jgi:predicted Zn-dependent protease with MMP-like domain
MDEAATEADREAAFEGYVEAALESIPEPFATHLGSVAIVIEDEPTADQLASVEAHGLFGLYQGVPRTAYGADLSPVPSKITIFRGPLERRHPTAADLEQAVADVVRHEVAHHLGISDARLHELQAPRREA